MRRVIIIACTLAIAMVSCQKEIQSPQARKVGTRLYAEIENVETKSEIDITGSNAKFRWTEGDKMAVYTTDGTFAEFRVAASADNSRAEFVCDEEVTPATGAIYPYNSAYSSSNLNAAGTKFTKVTLPDTYGSLDTPYVPSTNAPMIAYLGADNVVNFKHLGSVAKITVANVPTFARKLVFTYSGTYNITGDFTITTSGGVSTISSKKNEGSGKVVTILFEAFNAVQESVDFYVPLPLLQDGGISGQYPFAIQLKDIDDNVIIQASNRCYGTERAKVLNCTGADVLAGANCYMMESKNTWVNEKISINRVNAFWLDPNGGNDPSLAITESTVLTPVVLWQEGPDASDWNVKFYGGPYGSEITSFTGPIPFQVSVQSSLNPRNIVIGLKNSDDVILWSWHLWVTPYKIYLINGNELRADNGKIHQYFGAAFQTGGLYEGKYIMDRNLGATAGSSDYSAINPTSTPGIKGLYYQFGRKDPFQTKGAVTTQDGSSATLAEGVKKPTVFLNGGATRGNWYKNGAVNTDLWNGTTATKNLKSIYDPCPKGWRVPVGGSGALNNPWAGFGNNTYNSTASGTSSTYYLQVEASNGAKYYNSKNIAWYPNSGARDGKNGSLSYIDAGSGSGYTNWAVWSAAPYNYLRACSFYCIYRDSNFTVYPNYNETRRSYGLPVRCIEDGSIKHIN